MARERGKTALPVNPDLPCRTLFFDTGTASMSYSLDFSWLADAAGGLVRGAGMTLFLIACTTVLGIAISIFGAAGKRSKSGLLRRAIGAYVEVIRNTPFL